MLAFSLAIGRHFIAARHNGRRRSDVLDRALARILARREICGAVCLITALARSAEQGEDDTPVHGLGGRPHGTRESVLVRDERAEPHAARLALNISSAGIPTCDPAPSRTWSGVPTRTVHPRIDRGWRDSFRPRANQPVTRRARRSGGASLSTQASPALRGPTARFRHAHQERVGVVDAIQGAQRAQMVRNVELSGDEFRIGCRLIHTALYLCTTRNRDRQPSSTGRRCRSASRSYPGGGALNSG